MNFLKLTSLFKKSTILVVCLSMFLKVYPVLGLLHPPAEPMFKMFFEFF